MDITELVKRGFDTRPGGEVEAETARNALRRRVIENPETKDLRIWHGDPQSAPNIMDLLAEYKKPTELKIIQLEREARRKDRQISELTEQLRAGGKVATFSEELEETIRQKNAEISRLQSELERKPRTRVSASKREQQAKPREPDDSYVLTAEDYRELIAMVRQKKPKNDILLRFGMTSGTFNNRVWNAPPNELFFGEIPVGRDDGPMDIMELWKIGFHLYGRPWRLELTTRFKLIQGGISFNEPFFLTREQRLILRNEYWTLPRFHKPRELGTKAKEVLARVRAAGPDGTTIDETQRSTELRDLRLIFDSDKRAGPTGAATVWVAAEFKAQYPEQWKALERMLANIA